MCANFQAQRTTLTFSAQIWPKNEFWDQNFEILSPNSESAPPLYHVSQFLGKMNNFEFFGPNFPKNKFWVGNSEN